MQRAVASITPYQMFFPAPLNHFQPTRASQPPPRCYSHSDALFGPSSRPPSTLRRKLASFLQENNYATAHTPFHPPMPPANRQPPTANQPIATN